MSITEVTYAAIHVRTVNDSRQWADFAVLAVDDGMSTTVRIFTHGDRPQMLFDALDHLLRTATSPVVLYVNNSYLRQRLFDLRDCAALAQVWLSEELDGGPLCWVNNRAYAVADGLMSHTAVTDFDDVHSRRIPEIAANASRRAHHRGFGIACVREDGHYRAHYIDSRGPLVAGELEAIAVAAESFHHSAITILTGSRDAIGYLSRTSTPADGAVRNPVLRIRKVMEYRDINLRWVRATTHVDSTKLPAGSQWRPAAIMKRGSTG